MHLLNTAVDKLRVNLHEPFKVPWLAGVNHGVDVSIEIRQLTLRLHGRKVGDLIITNVVHTDHCITSLSSNGITNRCLVLEVLLFIGRHVVLHGLRRVQVHMGWFRTALQHFLGSRITRRSVARARRQLRGTQLRTKRTPGLGRVTLSPRTSIHAIDSSIRAR